MTAGNDCVVHGGPTGLGEPQRRLGSIDPTAPADPRPCTPNVCAHCLDMRGVNRRHAWTGGATAAAGLWGYGVWLVCTDTAPYRFLVRLYVDKKFLKTTLNQWGILAPVLFMVLQALQVIISPIPGDATGFLGGYLFGEWLGLLYST